MLSARLKETITEPFAVVLLLFLSLFVVALIRFIISQVPSLDVAVPMHLKGQRARHNSLTEESENLNFVVMLKKGNKQQFKGKQVLFVRVIFIYLKVIARFKFGFILRFFTSVILLKWHIP